MLVCFATCSYFFSIKVIEATSQIANFLQESSSYLDVSFLSVFYVYFVIRIQNPNQVIFPQYLIQTSECEDNSALEGCALTKKQIENYFTQMPTFLLSQEWIVILSYFILVQAAFKNLLYLRIYSNIAQIIRLSTNVFKESASFSLFYLFLVCIFTFGFQLVGNDTGGQPDDHHDGGEDYEGLKDYMGQFVYTLRLSIGDIEVPNI